MIFKWASDFNLACFWESLHNTSFSTEQHASYIQVQDFIGSPVKILQNSLLVHLKSHPHNTSRIRIILLKQREESSPTIKSLINRLLVRFLLRYSDHACFLIATFLPHASKGEHDNGWEFLAYYIPPSRMSFSYLVFGLVWGYFYSSHLYASFLLIPISILSTSFCLLIVIFLAFEKYLKANLLKYIVSKN